MSEANKRNFLDWVRAFIPIILAGLLGLFAHVRAMDKLSTVSTEESKTSAEWRARQDEQLTKLLQSGSEAEHLTAQKVEFVTDRLGKLEVIQTANAIAITDMRIDVRVISEWVKDQKAARANFEMPLLPDEPVKPYVRSARK